MVEPQDAGPSPVGHAEGVSDGYQVLPSCDPDFAEDLSHGFADGVRSHLEIASHLFLTATGKERLDDLALPQLELSFRPRLAVAEANDEVSLSATEGGDVQLAK